MFEKYPFIVPLFFIWLILWILTVVVFYTSFGLQQRPILNRVFLKRFASITLFIVFLMLMVSGLLQLAGFSTEIGGKPSRYWHALDGYLFILLALNHITIHLKDLYRYIFKRKVKEG